MFLAKIKVVAGALALVSVVCLGVGVYAHGQVRSSVDPLEPPKVSSLEDQKPGMNLHRIQLDPDALARHLGVHYSTCDVIFDKAPRSVTFTVEAYQEGKKIPQGENAFNSISSPDVDGLRSQKHRCIVLFSHRRSENKLDFTIVTADGSVNGTMEDPIAIPGTYPGPRLDAKGRVLLAALADRGRAPNEITIENASRALVLQVTTK